MATNKYVSTIGLEIHVHLKTKSKMFCSCANEDLTEPNKNICPICSAQPGALPVANRQAIEWTWLLGIALNSEIAPRFNFERKNYFYPDLPKGYQITSSTNPPCIGGEIKIGERKIRVNHIHLEEDTGKSIHDKTGKATLIDLNRAGAPLVELVTEPDITSGFEAKTFCQELQLILRYLKIADADMEKGQMRCEVNISLRPEGQKEFGTKVEVKNLNSFKTVERAIDYEIIRQTKLLEQGEKVIQENRGWRDDLGETVAQRSKEEAHDYRYFPEPDLPPIVFDQDEYEKLQAKIPELPMANRERFYSEYGFSLDDARLLTADQNTADYAENTISELRAWLNSLPDLDGTEDEIWDNNKKKLIKLLSGWLTSELFKLMNEKQITVKELKITPENFAEFITLFYQSKINSSAGQIILKEMFATGGDPSDILAEKNLAQVEDESVIEAAADKVIAEFPGEAEKYRGGKESLLQFFVGKVMAETQGKANPQTAQKVLKKKLK